MKKIVSFAIALLLIAVIPVLFIACTNALMEVLQSPEVTVLYNDQEIKSGDTLTIENTLIGESTTLQFTIRNKGKTAVLILPESASVAISGVNPSMFSLIPLEENIIQPESSELFTLNFTTDFDPPPEPGTKEIDVTIQSNDSDEGVFTYKIAAPTSLAFNGSIVENIGKGYSNYTDVTLDIFAENLAGITVTEMFLSNDSDFSTGDWEVYTTEKEWTIAPGFEETKTIYIKFKDSMGNVCPSSSYPIFLTENGIVGISVLGATIPKCW